jgi:hypothetical protein
LLVRWIVVAGGGGVFDVAVVGHGGKLSESLKRQAQRG